MSRRTYNQFCGVAQALDIIGERWTMLILRDLLPGPLRYTDLANKQPGMSSDLLSMRLRSLEDAKVVERRELIPPGGVTVYEIQKDAYEPVEAVVTALGGFGSRHLPDPVETEAIIDPAWAFASLAGRLRRHAPDGGGLHAVTDRGSVRLRSTAEGSVVEYCSSDGADVVLAGEPRLVMAVLTSRLTPSQAEVTVQDPLGKLQAWVDAITTTNPWSTDQP